MSIYVQYMVKCAGGGWLAPGRPLLCLGVAVKFNTAGEAHATAIKSGWSYDPVTKEHRCPKHD